MWFPHSVLVPIYLEPSARRSAEAPAAVMWPVMPFDQRFRLAVNELSGYPEHRMSVEDGMKFLLNKSVFELVKVSHFLELTDPKLLGWYLSLPEEDRKLIQEEGGLLLFLHRHPALEVSRHIVQLKQHMIGHHLPLPSLDMSSNHERSRRGSFYGMSQCANCGTSCPPGATKCRHCSTLNPNPDENVCISEEEKALRLLPNNVREELNLLKIKEHASERMSLRSFQHVDSMHSVSYKSSGDQNKLLSSVQQQLKKNSSDTQLLCQMWDERVLCDGKDVGVFKDPSAQASLLLDKALEMQGYSQSVHDHAPLLGDSNTYFPNLKEESLPEYYSFNSTTAEHISAQSTDSMNTSVMATKGSTETSITVEPVVYGAENGTLPNSVSFHSNSSEWADLTDDCQNLSYENDLEFETKTDEFHSMIEDASSSAACIPRVDPSVSQVVDARNDFTEITRGVFVNHCQDASTDGASPPVNQGKQTFHRPTFEKCTITEVCMSDLDAVYEEFEKLRMIEEELNHLKNERASAGRPKNEKQNCHCGRGAVRRAIWAELRLLALQFAMCQQHCWRRFYTLPQCETSVQRTRALPDGMSQTLKSLEEDYLKMKRKILEGVPLDNLKPLSVDTKRFSDATCYRPSLIYEAFLGNSLLESSFNETNKSTSVLEDEGRTCQANEVLKMTPTEIGHLNKKSTPLQDDFATLFKPVSSGRSTDMPGSSQESGVHDSAKELNSSDAWFDAEEELGCDSQNCKEDRQIEQRNYMDSNNEQKEVRSGKKDQCLLLRVSNLPNSVTEHDLLLWFEKYHTNQVSLSNFSDSRVGIVSVRRPKDAEAAVREMNGLYIQGSIVHVEHIHKSPADGRATIKESCIQLSPTAPKAGSAEEETITHSANNNVHDSRTLRCSLAKLTNICTTPTASGTCVPQHYGTMGSFDTIMAQLSARHPKVGRQQLVNALLQLQAKHHGALSGMLLRDIVDMTSELLNQSTRE